GAARGRPAARARRACRVSCRGCAQPVLAAVYGPWREAAMSLPALPLRDLHEPLAPSLWPPAPGWWWLLAGVVIALVLLVARIWKRRLRRRNAARLFDGLVAAAEDPAARVAAMSELLRRAARRIEPGADRCEG